MAGGEISNRSFSLRFIKVSLRERECHQLAKLLQNLFNSVAFATVRLAGRASLQDAQLSLTH